MGLDPVTALIVSIIGNMVPVPFIIIFIRRILNWMHRFEKFDRIATKLEAKAAKGGEKLVKYSLYLLETVSCDSPAHLPVFLVDLLRFSGSSFRQSSGSGVCVQAQRVFLARSEHLDTYRVNDAVYSLSSVSPPSPSV